MGNKDCNSIVGSAFEKPSEKILLVNRIKVFIWMLIVFGLGYFFLRNMDNYFYIFLGVWLALTLLFIVVIEKLDYKFTCYSLGEDAIEIRHGYLIAKRELVPYIRVQHTTESQGILQRIFGLYTIHIAVASDTFEIEGLTKQKADSIARQIAHLVQISKKDL